MTNVTLEPYEHLMAKKIDDYFRQELIFKRNRRMGQRVLELLAAHPDKSFFFAFGAGNAMNLERFVGFFPPVIRIRFVRWANDMPSLTFQPEHLSDLIPFVIV